MLLWLIEGVSTSEVARRMSLSRQAVHGVVRRYEERKGLPIVQRLADAAGRGRKALLKNTVKDQLQRLLVKDPQVFGYRTTCWTVPMIRTQLGQHGGDIVSNDTIRRALKELGYSYKRPRFVLSRQSKNWRQAKGGFEEACQH
jgi:transposase